MRQASRALGQRSAHPEFARKALVPPCSRSARLFLRLLYALAALTQTMDAYESHPELRRALTANLKLSDAQAASITRELFRFLRLCAENRASALSPSPAVDAAWHELLLIPVLYAQVCRAASSAAASSSTSASATDLEWLIPHSTAGALDADAVRRARYETTLRLYEATYAAPAPQDAWPRDYAALPLTLDAAAAAASQSPPAWDDDGDRRVAAVQTPPPNATTRDDDHDATRACELARVAAGLAADRMRPFGELGRTQSVGKGGWRFSPEELDAATDAAVQELHAAKRARVHGPNINLFYRWLDGSTRILHVSPTAAVGDALRALAAREQLPLQDMRVTWQSKPLQADCTEPLDVLGIQNESTLTVVLRLRGC